MHFFPKEAAIWAVMIERGKKINSWLRVIAKSDGESWHHLGVLLQPIVCRAIIYLTVDMCTPTLFIYGMTGCEVSVCFCFIHTCCPAKKGSSDVSQSLVLEWWTRDLSSILRIIVFNDTGKCRKRNGIQFLLNRNENEYESVKARMWGYFKAFFPEALTVLQSLVLKPGSSGLWHVGWISGSM